MDTRCRSNKLDSTWKHIRQVIDYHDEFSMLLVFWTVLMMFLLCREAMKRGTSVFLPTATYPMFPEKLAMEGMSLKQGELCNAVTVSVVLSSDGR